MTGAFAITPNSRSLQLQAASASLGGRTGLYPFFWPESSERLCGERRALGL